MTPLELLFIPGALAVVVGILVATVWLEASILSPRSLILHSVRTRSRRVGPEDVERLVAMQSERLIRDFHL